jgi:hypothetical protein
LCKDSSTFSRNKVYAIFTVATDFVSSILYDLILRLFICKIEQGLFSVACSVEKLYPIIPSVLIGGEAVNAFIDKPCKKRLEKELNNIHGDCIPLYSSRDILLAFVWIHKR